MDDYHPDRDIKYLDDLPSKSMMAEFEASRMELRKTAGNLYSEVLRKMATQRLDRDMTVIKVKGLESLAAGHAARHGGPVQNPQQVILGRGTVGIAGLHEQMLARNKFLRAHQDFYNAHGRQKEWQLWKRLLKGAGRI